MDEHSAKHNAIVIAISPAIIQASIDAGPKNPAPKAAAIYMSAPTMTPMTRFITSNNPRVRLNSDMVFFILEMIKIVNGNFHGTCKKS